MRKLILVAVVGLALTGCSKDRVFWDDNGKIEQKTENREIWEDNGKVDSKDREFWNSHGKMDSEERKFWNNSKGEPVIK